MIYKLKYTDQAEAISDLLAKGVLINTTDFEGNEVTSYGEKTEAVVYIGKIVDTPAVMEDMEVITEATFIEGYHVDIMVNEAIEFDNAIEPNNPKHAFAGIN